MKIWIYSMKTRQFGSMNSGAGIHLKKPDARELCNAVERACNQGFSAIYVYDSARDLRAVSDLLEEATGYRVGWSDYCVTLPAFVLDTETCWHVPSECSP